MSGIGSAIWRELVSQFLLTFSLLSTVGFGVWVVGAGWSSLRRHRQGLCPPSTSAPPFRGESPPRTEPEAPGQRQGHLTPDRPRTAQPPARGRRAQI